VSSLILSLLLQVSLFAAVADNSINSLSDTSSSNYTVSTVSTASAFSQATDASDSHDLASHTYAAAYQDAQESGKPLVILVGASWCPACQSMKTSTMPAVAAHGGLSNVAFAYVNTDAQSSLATQLMEGGLIPQLVVYEKTADGYKLSRLVGAQSVETVEGLLRPAADRAIAARQNHLEGQSTTAGQPSADKPALTQPSSAKQPTAQRSASQTTAG
jgi:thioredoxin-like negative regulator of GroEL